MSRECEICGKKPVAGRTYTRSGLSRRKGGGGQHITGKTARVFKPNIQKVRLDLNGTIRKVKICTRCMKNHAVKPSLVKHQASA